MEDERVVAVAGRGRLEAGAAAEAAERVLEALLAEDLLLELVLLLVVRLLLRLQPPELVGEREIGEHQRELPHPPVFEELRVGDRARAGLDVGFEAVQHGVDLADRGVAPVHLLREVAGAGGVVALLAEVVGRVHQHAARTGGGVVNRVARTRFENAHEGVHDFRRREELARLGARVVRELLDEVLVGPAQDVRRDALVRKVVLVEVRDERVDDLVRDERLAGAVGRGLVPVHGEDAAQLVVGVRHGAHRLRQHLADIRGCGLHVAPARAVRDLEAVLAALAEDCLLLLAEGAALLPLQLGDGVVGLALPLVAEALVEHQGQDVVLVVLTRGLAAEDVRRAPQMSFELLQRELHSRGCRFFIITPRPRAGTARDTPHSRSRARWPTPGAASAGAAETAPMSAARRRP